jgi:hypothetical protein
MRWGDYQPSFVLLQQVQCSNLYSIPQASMVRVTLLKFECSCVMVNPYVVYGSRSARLVCSRNNAAAASHATLCFSSCVQASQTDFILSTDVYVSRALWAFL